VGGAGAALVVADHAVVAGELCGDRAEHRGVQRPVRDQHHVAARADLLPVESGSVAGASARHAPILRCTPPPIALRLPGGYKGNDPPVGSSAETRKGDEMATVSVGSDILADENREKRDEVIELLTKAYWMEIETVMNYIANSVNP